MTSSLLIALVNWQIVAETQTPGVAKKHDNRFGDTWMDFHVSDSHGFCNPLDRLH